MDTKRFLSDLYIDTLMTNATLKEDVENKNKIITNLLVGLTELHSMCNDKRIPKVFKEKIADIINSI